MTARQILPREPHGPPIPLKSRCKNFAGQRAGKLELLIPWRQQRSNPPGFAWLARCECGTHRVDLPAALRRLGACGTCAPETAAERRQKDQTLMVDGRTQTLGDWHTETGIAVAELARRISAGWLPSQTIRPGFFEDWARHHAGT